jgi:hypothetical protein
MAGKLYIYVLCQCKYSGKKTPCRYVTMLPMLVEILSQEDAVYIFLHSTAPASFVVSFKFKFPRLTQKLVP